MACSKKLTREPFLNSTLEVGEEIHKPQWKYFFRQLLIASGTWNVYFTVGMFLGAPTVFVPQMRSQANSTEVISEEMASWLSSSSSYSALPWIFILPNIARNIGRRKIAIFSSFSSICAYIVFYFSTSTTYILISGLFIGVTLASTVTITVMVLSEYISPNNRGLFLTIKSATLFWGVWVSNIIGTYTHWTYIPLFGLFSSLYSLSAFFWPESPQWLASKMRLNDCRKSHRWLKGTNIVAEMELENMIKNEIKNTDGTIDSKLNFRSKEFYMPLALSFLTILQYHLSGKFVISVYAIDVIKKIVADKSAVYRSMLILDGVTVAGSYIGCILTKILRRRTLLLTSSTIAIMMLYSLSLYMFLVKIKIITENKYLSVFLLGAYCISVSSGPMIMATSLYGELVSSRFKNISIILLGTAFVGLLGMSLKFAPMIFMMLGMYSTFLFYGIFSSVCIVLIYFYLPETKDKTLLEIEEHFRDVPSLEGVELVKKR